MAGRFVSEQEWIRIYEESQAAALGDPSYHLPTKDELLAEHRARDAKRKRESVTSSA